MLHKAVKEFKNVKVSHHNYPFDKECNRHVTLNAHPYACYMSKAAIASRNQGNYWEMSSLIYENQPKTEKALLKLVEKLHFDKEMFLKDMESEETIKEIKDEIQKAIDLKVDATPTMFVNGEKHVGVKPYKNVQEVLIKHGAKK